jgi:hypothetical protein
MSPDSEEARPPAAPPAVHSRVRVRKGVRDPDFPDVPLGGWAGTVIEQEDGDGGPLFLVEWDEATLRQMHPVFRHRCERDGLEVERTWLNAADLDLDTGGPAEIEQPGTLTPRPLDPGDQDDRVRAVFGLTSDDPLPAPDMERLRQYHGYLSERLRFPLDALYAQTQFYLPGREETVRFVGLAPAESVREKNGLLAEIERGGAREAVELFDVEVPGNDFVRQLIGDYSYWFCEMFRYAVGGVNRQEVGGGGREEGTVVSLPSLLLRGALYGAVLGAVVGSVVAAVDGAALGLAVAAGVFATIGYVFGSRLGALLRALRLGSRTPLFGGIFGALFGALLGVVVGPMLVAFPGTMLGSVAGYLVGRTLAMLGVRRPGGVFGGILGAGAGAVVWAWVYDADRAVTGLVTGGAIGAGAGVLLIVAFLLSLIAFQTPPDEQP